MVRRFLSLLGLTAAGLSASAVIAPAFSGAYTAVDLGSVPGLAELYGGITFVSGDANTLLIGGDANGSGGVIDSIGLTRDANGDITGFTGTAALYSTAPYVDGGLAYAPNGDLLFTAYPTNQIGEIQPGSSSPNLTVVAPGPSSVGTLGFVPEGYAGAGALIVGSYTSGQFCTASLSPSGGGYTAGPCIDTETVDGGPEGIAYVPIGSPGFATPSVLVSQYNTGAVSVFQLDPSGLPDASTERTFLSGLTAVEGAAIDPVTGDLLFSAFGSQDEVYEVQGFSPPAGGTPEPSSLALLGAGLSALIGIGRKLKGARR